MASDLLKILESVVAPATALTALMYYFGLLHAYWFLQTFGVEYTVMGFTTYDYLIRSADGLFVPLAATAGAALIVLWAYGPLSRRISPKKRRVLLRVGSHFALSVGSLLLIVAIIGIVRPHTWYAFVGLPGLALALGVLSINLAVKVHRQNLYRKTSDLGHSRPSRLSPKTTERVTPRRTAAFWEWASIFLLVNVGLFWAAADYSAAVGSQRGADLVAALPWWPDVVIYSERDLNLSTSDVLETVCGDPESAYRYRYDGLKLILQSGNQYLFLPASWGPSRGTALVVPRTDGIRLDFATAGAIRKGSC